MSLPSDAVPPDFLGIGVPKAGTTWLHAVLRSHPSIWVPERREVHYFDRHYDRGLDWYRQFWPSQRDGDHFQAIGEVTPHYLYGDHCPERIAGTPSIRKLIVILRSPVDRAYSHYWFRVRTEHYRGTFEDFLAERAEAIAWGLYAEHLKKFLSIFDREQLLAFVYEELFDDLAVTLGRLAEFLAVDAAGFSEETARSRINPRQLPRFPRAYAAAFSIGRWLQWHDAYGIIGFARKLDVMSWFGRDKSTLLKAPMKPETRERLASLFADDIDELEGLLDLDLGAWKRHTDPTS